MQFFIVPVASWVRTRRFSEPTFRPSGATNHWKNTVFRDFPAFSRICIFCPLTLSLLIFSLLIFLFSLPLPCSAFHLSILSEVWLLNFLRQVGRDVEGRTPLTGEQLDHSASAQLGTLVVEVPNSPPRCDVDLSRDDAVVVGVVVHLGSRLAQPRPWPPQTRRWVARSAWSSPILLLSSSLTCWSFCQKLASMFLSCACSRWMSRSAVMGLLVVLTSGSALPTVLLGLVGPGSPPPYCSGGPGSCPTSRASTVAHGVTDPPPMHPPHQVGAPDESEQCHDHYRRVPHVIPGPRMSMLGHMQEDSRPNKAQKRTCPWPNAVPLWSLLGGSGAVIST